MPKHDHGEYFASPYGQEQAQHAGRCIDGEKERSTAPNGLTERPGRKPFHPKMVSVPQSQESLEPPTGQQDNHWPRRTERLGRLIPCDDYPRRNLGVKASTSLPRYRQPTVENVVDEDLSTLSSGSTDDTLPMPARVHDLDAPSNPKHSVPAMTFSRWTRDRREATVKESKPVFLDPDGLHKVWQDSPQKKLSAQSSHFGDKQESSFIDPVQSLFTDWISNNYDNTKSTQFMTHDSASEKETGHRSPTYRYRSVPRPEYSPAEYDRVSACYFERLSTQSHEREDDGLNVFPLHATAAPPPPTNRHASYRDTRSRVETLAPQRKTSSADWRHTYAPHRQHHDNQFRQHVKRSSVVDSEQLPRTVTSAALHSPQAVDRVSVVYDVRGSRPSRTQSMRQAPFSAYDRAAETTMWVEQVWYGHERQGRRESRGERVH
jgi:hypothetical protein